MALRAEDPSQLSKSRLKSDLVAHNVALPPSKSRKEVYVELHLKHIERKTAADFSSDEEEQARHAKEEHPEVPDPGALTDDDLQAALLKRGVKVGPVVASTRALYEKKLLKLLQPDGHGQLNGADSGAGYSDSEGEERGGEGDDAESDCEEEKQTVQRSDQAPQQRRQCFLLSSRLRVPASRARKPIEWNSRNASSERSRSRCSQISAGVSRASSIDQRSGLGPGVPPASQTRQRSDSSSFSITQMVEEMETRRSLSSPNGAESELSGSKVPEHRSRSDGLDMAVVDERTRTDQSLYYTPKASAHKTKTKLHQEPVEPTFKDMFAATESTPTGIYATQRRPIKGAAGRPVRYAYPDTPSSPSTLQRREVARRLVPVHIQLVVFLVVTCLLYFIYVCVEDNSWSPFLASLDNRNQGPDSEEGLLLQADTPALSGQE
ncbi:LEM domain-containing protein 1 isoform X2 [Betta splendens]|uniref:LEM domain-containing protein 1 isoform X2 n=1 Tax=Betta splendens TaxID=158456 RepID=A0A6P7N1M4_BETSP|nr:LEM domain-containing protein 1 isoform X2 [Betta splendens]